MSIYFEFKFKSNLDEVGLKKFFGQLYDLSFRISEDEKISKTVFVEKMKEFKNKIICLIDNKKINFFIGLRNGIIECSFREYGIYDENVRGEVKRVLLQIIDLLNAKSVSISIDDGTKICDDLDVEIFKKRTLGYVLHIADINSPV